MNIYGGHLNVTMKELHESIDVRVLIASKATTDLRIGPYFVMFAIFHFSNRNHTKNMS